MPSAYVFDLDGTLIDSLPDIADALDELILAEGHEALGMERISKMIGHGVEKLVQRGFAARDVSLADSGLSAMTDRFRAIYEPRAAHLTTLFPHVKETVEAIATRGIPMAVCTNKPSAVSRDILGKLGLDPYIPVVVGGDFGGPRKPAPDMVLEVARQLGIAPASGLFVGDSGADVGAARAAGMPVVVVPYGYTAVPPGELGADKIIADFRDLI